MAIPSLAHATEFATKMHNLVQNRNLTLLDFLSKTTSLRASYQGVQKLYAGR